MNELDFHERFDKKDRQSSSFFTVYEQREGINDASPDKLNSIKALNNEYFLGLDDEYLQGKKIVACGEPTTEDSITLQAVNGEIHIKYMDSRYLEGYNNIVRIIIKEDKARQVVYDDKLDEILFDNTFDRKTEEEIAAINEFNGLFKEVGDGLQYTDPDKVNVHISRRESGISKEYNGQIFHDFGNTRQSISIVAQSSEDESKPVGIHHLERNTDGFYYSKLDNNSGMRGKGNHHIEGEELRDTLGLFDTTIHQAKQSQLDEEHLNSKKDAEKRRSYLESKL